MPAVLSTLRSSKRHHEVSDPPEFITPPPKKSCYLNGSKSFHSLDDEQLKRRQKNASRLQAARKGETIVQETLSTTIHLDASDHLAEYNAIILLWKKMGCEPTNEWGNLNIINNILAALMLTHNSYTRVKKILVNHINTYGLDPKIAYKECLTFHTGPECIIDKRDLSDGSDAMILYALIPTGISDTDLTFRLNTHRATKNQKPVCRNTVRRFKIDNPMVKTNKRGTKVSTYYINNTLVSYLMYFKLGIRIK